MFAFLWHITYDDVETSSQNQLAAVCTVQLAALLYCKVTPEAVFTMRNDPDEWAR
jgi:hypothetical protein